MNVCVCREVFGKLSRYPFIFFFQGMAKWPVELLCGIISCAHNHACVFKCSARAVKYEIVRQWCLLAVNRFVVRILNPKI